MKLTFSLLILIYNESYRRREENAKIQLEAISNMYSFGVCRPWIKPKQGQQQQQSCAKQDGELNCWD